MRHHIRHAFTAIGLLLVAFGVVLILLSSGKTLYAQQDLEDADYVGSRRECSSCHRDLARSHAESRHALTLQEADEDIILADFDQGEAVRMVQFPDEDTPRAFTADDVASVVGTGRYVQRYLYEVARDEYAVFPAEWNTVEGIWQPYVRADAWPDAAYDWTQNCSGCHTTGLNPSRGRWEEDGVQCEACHGPGSVHAEIADDADRDPSDADLREIRSAIVVGVDAQVCGQCHSSGTEPEDNLPFPVEYRPGTTLLDDRIFTLTPPEDTAHWWTTDHASAPNMQFNEWYQSGHASSLTTLRESDAAENLCLQCHSADYRYNELLIAAVTEGERSGDAPEPLTLDTAQQGITCGACHEAHPDEPVDFNLITEGYNLCVQCHSDRSADQIHHPVQQMYEGQPLIDNVEAVASSHFSTVDGPDCLTCHVPEVPVDGFTRASHSLRPVLPGEALTTVGLPDTCTTCHGEEVDAADMQQLIDDVQTSTQARLETDRAALTDITPEWVIVALDFVEGDGSLGIHNYAYTDALLDAVEAELGLAG